jgi:hypothetical protein
MSNSKEVGEKRKGWLTESGLVKAWAQSCIGSRDLAGHWRFTPVILATQEAEIRRIMVQSQLGQRVY